MSGNSRPQSFLALATHSKTQVYYIVRIRGGRYINLGTGFLVGEQRLMTCFHCINDVTSDEPLAKHQDGDIYLFVQRDDTGGWHRYGFESIRDNNLFLHQEMDIAVFYLPGDFYKLDGREYKKPSDHLRLCSQLQRIGADIGILGYPLSQIAFDETGEPDIKGIHIRADRGVLNASYVDSSSLHIYEFTTAFNPGNSGGPIFDIESGKVLAIVQGFNPIPIRVVEDEIPANTHNNPQAIKQLAMLRATYSIGISSTNIEQIAEAHSIKLY